MITITDAIIIAIITIAIITIAIITIAIIVTSPECAHIRLHLVGSEQ
jgi:hypothetical protein